jgi:hypothetical protein
MPRETPKELAKDDEEEEEEEEGDVDRGAAVSEEEEEQQEEEEEEEEGEHMAAWRSRSSALPDVGQRMDADAEEEYAHQEHEQVFMQRRVARMPDAC